MQPQRYTYLRELSSGGSTRVVVAVDRDTGVHVVVKSLQLSFAANPTRRAAFLEEVQRMQRARGERLLAVLDAELEGRIPFVVTAHVEGPTLEQLVARDGPLSPAKTRHLGVGLCEALDTLHDTGLVHCDLAPKNVIMGSEGPVLVDLGTAAPLGTRRPRAGAYRPLEMRRGAPVTAATDIFGLGCLLSFAVTGRRPHRRIDRRRALSRLLAAPHRKRSWRLVAKALRPRRPGLASVPDDLRSLLERMVRMDPHKRPPLASVARSLSDPPPR